MKSASLFLSLIACGQTPQDNTSQPGPILGSDDAALTLPIVSLQLDTHSQATVEPSQVNVDPLSTGESIEEPRSNRNEPEPLEGDPILVCASAVGMGMVFNPEDVDPEILYSVSRISIFETDDTHAVTIETGSAHDPSRVFGKAVHSDVHFNMDEYSLDISWDGSSIMGWRSPEYGSVISGGGWGDIATPIFDTGEPPPPCGFEIYLSCWEPNKTESPFQYDKKSGQCLNADGQEGLNYKPIEYIRETGDGECAELSWSYPSEFIPFDIELRDWDLRGAKLDSARLGIESASDDQAPHHTLVNARLDGADLSTLDAVNASILGTIDAHTQLPNMDCIIEDDTLIDCEI